MNLEQLTAYRESLAEILDYLYTAVFTTTEWTSESEEIQLELRELIDDGQALFERTLRPKFDQAIWSGLAEPSVSSIRTKSEGEKPGRKAEVPTAAETLARMKRR